MVAPELEAAHGHERLPAAGHQPEALVVDAQVVRPRAEVAGGGWTPRRPNTTVKTTTPASVSQAAGWTARSRRRPGGRASARRGPSACRRHPRPRSSADAASSRRRPSTRGHRSRCYDRSVLHGRGTQVGDERRQHAVDEASAVVGGEALGQLDGLVDDDGDRHVRPLGQLEGAEAQHVEVEHGHPGERPAGGPGGDRRRRVGRGARRRRARASPSARRARRSAASSASTGRDALGLRLVEQVQRPLAGVGAAVGRFGRALRSPSTHSDPGDVVAACGCRP